MNHPYPTLNNTSVPFLAKLIDPLTLEILKDALEILTNQIVQFSSHDTITVPRSLKLAAKTITIALIQRILSPFQFQRIIGF